MIKINIDIDDLEALTDQEVKELREYVEELRRRIDERRLLNNRK